MYSRYIWNVVRLLCLGLFEGLFVVVRSLLWAVVVYGILFVLGEIILSIWPIPSAVATWACPIVGVFVAASIAAGCVVVLGVVLLARQTALALRNLHQKALSISKRK